MKTDVRYAPPAFTRAETNSFLRTVLKLNYRERRKFFAKNVRPKYPRFQYKYMSIPAFDETKRTGYVRDILVESLLWLSSPLDFNDPYDMSAKVVFDSDTKVIREKYKSLVKEQAVEENWKQKKDILEKFMAGGRSEWLASIKRVFSKSQKETGIFSFAGDPRSILMWSHYAYNHTGICLQFETVKDPEVLSGALPVIYTDDYPIFDWAAEDNDIYRRILLSKYKAWDYEQEARIVWSKGAHTYLQYSPEALVGVIFGCQADERVIGIVKNLLEERKSKGLPPVRLFEAYKHSSKYKLVLKSKNR
ncbi:DUF2971 domain-containing protein [Methyloradius palustris]|uniref:DUF2971 domain-containing protein n=1 Tax=Methyloradius palustris TaxID=2778876 RepID=A0A8D5GD78_9PROT|nr:DUF2971 domain-containing protein [Methyloradius palustris]BCM24459.1 hypothetical protein ZMTM_07180 [Methyloradius palustris]